jgi:VCBS repeat-containing protein
VLNNDSDPDEDALFVFEFASGTQTGAAGDTIAGVYGDLTMAADGTWTYGLRPGAALGLSAPSQDVFSYTVSDGHGGFDTATLRIIVDSPIDTGGL